MKETRKHKSKNKEHKPGRMYGVGFGAGSQ